jgi:hypothetical protein
MNATASPQKKFKWYDGPRWLKWFAFLLVITGVALTIIRHTLPPQKQLWVSLSGIIGLSFIMSLAAACKTFVKEK